MSLVADAGPYWCQLAGWSVHVLYPGNTFSTT